VAERPERRIELSGERRRQVVREQQRPAVARRRQCRCPAQGVIAGIDQRQRQQLLAGAAQAGAVEPGGVELDHGFMA
jgi:hypothetical protein